MSISRDTARKRTTAAMAGALVLAGTATAVLLLPSPSLRSAQAVQPIDPNPPTEPAGGAHAGDQAPIDVPGLASTLSDLNRRTIVDPVETPVVAEAPAPTDTPAAPPPAAGEWRFVGSIVGPSKTHAMVSIDGKQELLTAGTERNGVKLVSVDREKIVIDRSGELKTIPLAARQNPWADASATPARARSLAPSLPADFEKLPPEEQARVLENHKQQQQMQLEQEKGGMTPPPAVQPYRPGPSAAGPSDGITNRAGAGGQPPRRPSPLGTGPGGAGSNRH